MNTNEDLLNSDFVTRVASFLATITSAQGSGTVNRDLLESLLQAARFYQLENDLKELTNRYELRLLIDDLDRNWSPNSESSSKLIVTLLNEIQRLMVILTPNMKPAVFLRKDVFSWLVSHDQEILKRDPGFLQWSRDGLENLIASRIATHLSSPETSPDKLWREIFTPHVYGQPVQEFIATRTLMRPRDIVQFCQKAVEEAQRAGRQLVGIDDLRIAWEHSGQLILAQTETEYQHRYPRLMVPTRVFVDAPPVRKWDELKAALVNQIRREDQPPEWLAAGVDNPWAVVGVLYETGIVGLQTAGGAQWFEADSAFSEIESALPENPTILVHPAFHRAFRCAGT